MHVFVFIYIHNKYTQYTHVLCKQKLLLWMQLIAINRLTALIILYYIILYKTYFYFIIIIDFFKD